MRKNKHLTIVVASMAAALFYAAAVSPVRAATTPVPVALAGQVSSQEEGPMEGVVVSAKKVDSTITISVVSDQQGRYSFPRNRVQPGQYSLSVRAVGYDLVNNPAQAEITAQKAAKADLKLRKTTDLAAQLTNTEWLMSMPGDEKQKGFLLGCVTCHTLQRIVNSHHDSTEFAQVIQRMYGYASGSSPMFPQRSRAGVLERNLPTAEILRPTTDYLSTINLSKVSKWEYPLKTLPRPKGKATRVIITEYNLPRNLAQPHDVIVDSEGMVWYSDFGQQYMGKMDPKTGKVTDYPIPELKSGFPRGGLDLVEDKEGNMWLSQLEQGGVAKFDKRTQKMQMFPLPKELNSDENHVSMLASANLNVDGKVWVKDDAGDMRLYRLDAETGKYETVPYGHNPVTHKMEHSGYGLATDSQNNLYVLDSRGEDIAKVDAKTLEVKYYPTPTRGSVFPRRGTMDSQDRLWMGYYRANKLAMFDTRAEKFQEWLLPTPFTNPYDAALDKNGDMWSGGMTSDRILRLDTKSGQVTEYLLPQETNIRKVFVDSSTTPVSFWVGNDHHASIVKVEPLD